MNRFRPRQEAAKTPERQKLNDLLAESLAVVVPGHRSIVGASPSGKAAGFDPAIRRFESFRPSHDGAGHEAP